MSERRSGLARGAVAAALASIAALAGATTVFAGALAAGTLVKAPDDPLAAAPGCAPIVAQQKAKGSVNYPDAEVEPWVAADPTDPRHLIASFQQDRWNDGGADGEITVVSHDGGTSWTLASGQPRFGICQGATPGAPGGLNRVSDPWVSIAPDGTAYQSSLSFDANGPGFGGTSSVVVSTSGDGGTTWGAPVNVQLDTSLTVLNDKESVTADPTKPGTAYVVWDRLISPSVNANPTAFLVTPAFRGPAMFARTTDGGAHFSPSQVMFDPGEKNQTIGNQIVVEPDGTLVDGLDVIHTKGGKGNPSVTYDVAVIRSTDGGATWSAPTVVSSIVDAPVSIKGQPVRTGDVLPEFAVDPHSGTLYAAWQDGRFSPAGVARVAFSQSTDHGSTWSPPIEIDQAPPGVAAFTPAVDVASDGTVGVTYYDFESATAASPGDTDVFIVHCHAATGDCAQAGSWAAGGETKLDTTGPFDMTTAPFAEGYFTGDYEGLTSSGTTHDAFFVMAKPIATKGATDPFANTAS